MSLCAAAHSPHRAHPTLQLPWDSTLGSRESQAGGYVTLGNRDPGEWDRLLGLGEAEGNSCCCQGLNRARL